jgi:uncharacterized membrane protein YedE/YeeE
MTALISAAFCGVVFGLGLLISGMAQPAKVLNFLDVFGRWDPSLAVVMAAALAASWVGFALARRRQKPACAERWHWPDRTEIDAPLIAGSALFGIGWGLAGLCPGPALVDLLTGSLKVVAFVIAMGGGMIVHDAWRGRARSSATEPAASAADG